MVTKTQKVNALAILLTERYIRQAYEMPTEETDGVIAHLIADLNGELAYFWQFSFAFQTELRYLIANNPEPVFRNLTEEQNTAIHERLEACVEAVAKLAEYDEEIAQVYSKRT